MPEIFEGGVARVITRAVVIGNGFAGAENQCLGLVRALGLSGRISFFRVTRPRGGFNEFLRWLPVSAHKKLEFVIRRVFANFLSPVALEGSKVVPLKTERNGEINSSRLSKTGGSAGLFHILEAEAKQIANEARDTFEKNGPMLVIASGRDTVSVASSIKRFAPEHVFVVQIQHPRMHLSRFDLVVTPRHDYYPLTPHAQEQIPWFLRRWITPREPPGKNVFLTDGALHQADVSALRSAASTWHNELAPLPKPLLVVNIGGPAGNCPYSEDLAVELAAMLHTTLWSCGSVRISFSRRTPEKISKLLEGEFSTNPKVYIWDGKGSNPHMGHLAWADAFVITADSISMLSEACSTGKPVYVVGAEKCTWKFADFQKSLIKRGAIRPFTGNGNISESWSYPPLNDTAEAARKVTATLAERGWRIRV